MHQISTKLYGKNEYVTQQEVSTVSQKAKKDQHDFTSNRWIRLYLEHSEINHKSQGKPDWRIRIYKCNGPELISNTYHWQHRKLLNPKRIAKPSKNTKTQWSITRHDLVEENKLLKNKVLA